MRMTHLQTIFGGGMAIRKEFNIGVNCVHTSL